MQRITFLPQSCGHWETADLSDCHDYGSVYQCGTGSSVCGSVWLGCTGSSDCHGDCTGLFSSVLSAHSAAHSGCASDKRRFSSAAGDESAALKLAAPLAIQNVIISVGGLTVQYVVNGFGFLFVAGFTAANKLYGVLEMASVSYGYAITTYVGQNLGAKEYRRIRNGVRSGVYMALITSIVISGVMVITGRNILSLFVSGEAGQVKQVLDIAYKYLFIMAIFLWVLYLLYVYRSAIQGLGNTLIPLASGVVEFCMRVGVALLLPETDR